MSGDGRVETNRGAHIRERRFGWLLDPQLVTTAVGSVAVVAIAGLVQVSFGAYSMTLSEA